MVKKRSIINKTLPESSTTSIKPADKKALEDDLSLLDHSVIREPINLGIKNVHQIITCISDGTREVKDLIFNECNIIYECRICRNLFRSLANFLAHKRLYCKEHCCEKMVLFDPDWFPTKKQSFAESENTSLDSEPGSKISQLVVGESSNGQAENKKNNSNENQGSNEICDKPQVDTPISKQSSNQSNQINPEQRIVKKKRIENLFNRLNTAKLCVINSSGPINETSDQSITKQATESHIIKNAHDSDNNHIDDISLESNILFQKSSSGINFICNYCNVTCTYISSSIRHLINFHHMSRDDAKNLVFSHMKKAQHVSNESIQDRPETKMIITDISKSETSIDVSLKIEEKSKDVGESNRSTSFYDLSSPSSNKVDLSINDSLTNATTNEQQEISFLETNIDQTSISANSKRYETRCSIRKKCFYNCNSKSCFFSKHCSNNQHLTTANNDVEDNLMETNKFKDSEMGSSILFRQSKTKKGLLSSLNSDLIATIDASMTNHQNINQISINKKKKKMKKLKKMNENLNKHNNVKKRYEKLQETDKVMGKTQKIMNNSSSINCLPLQDKSFENDNNNTTYEDSNELNSNDASKDVHVQKIIIQKHENTFPPPIFDDETDIGPVVESSHSPLITKLSLKKFDSNNHRKNSKESRLKIHLRPTSGSKKCYQIVDT